MEMGTNLTDATWGIPGPTFLVLVLVAGSAAVVAAVHRRHRIAAGDRRGGRGLDTRPEDVAYLNGGPDLAVYAALSAMHVDGTVITSGRTTGQVRAGGPLTRAATPLQRAIHRSAQRLTPGRALRTHEPVRTELARIAQRLETAGLLLSPADRRRYRAAAWLPGAVALVGVVRIGAGLGAGRPVGYLFLTVVVLGVVTAVLAARVPHRTAAGTAALGSVRVLHESLSPTMRPDWTAAGATAAALSVGAFGMGAMLAAEPAFAEELAAQKMAALGGGTGGGWSGSGGSGGSTGFSGGDGGSSGGGGGCGGGGGGCGG
ncbi:hypothetical protein Ae150APs1_2375 [Pseudonocardia sp. Ae150A_Ps1]|nr:hypothetical protein Ae150APs1_2375 [Pseudonocardia sp. Ae150A_Ps1]